MNVCEIGKLSAVICSRSDVRYSRLYLFAIKISGILKLNSFSSASVFIRPVFASYWTLPIQLTYEYTEAIDTRIRQVRILSLGLPFSKYGQ